MTFEYLSARYPADTSADELLTRITEVRSTVTEIADYTRHRQTEEVPRKEREADKLVHREEYPQLPPQVEYSLPARGKSLRPILDGMCVWE